MRRLDTRAHGRRPHPKHDKVFEEQPLLTQAAESILIECIKWIVREQKVPNWRAAVRTSPATYRISRRAD